MTQGTRGWAVLLALVLFACSSSAPPAELDGQLAQISQAVIQDAAHANSTSFTFLPSISAPAKALRNALHVNDPAYFFAGANPVVTVDEYLEEPATGDLSEQRPIAVYTMKQADEDRVKVEDGVVFNDTVNERTSYYQARLNLERFQRELDFKLYPHIYRISVAVGAVTVGFADIALSSVTVINGRKKYELKIKNLRRQLECDEAHLPLGSCKDDYVVLDDGFNLSVRFWLNRCAGKTLAAADDCHEAAACNPLTGEVTSRPRPDGTACNDHNSCTFADACQAGACVGTSEALASETPKDLVAPALAVDERSVVLAWHKPDDYHRIVDYRVYENGVPLGNAATGGISVSPSKPYTDNFYARDVAQFHVKAATHNYTAQGLSENTAYSWSVRSVLADGCESADSNVVVRATLPTPPIIDVSSFGAIAGLSDPATVQGNTAAIQAAIDACPQNGKVLIPGGAGQRQTFVSGALFLKSNMTFEIDADATLQGAAVAGYVGPNFDDNYPLAKGFYPNPEYLVTLQACQDAGRGDCVCADGGADANPTCLVNAPGYVSFRRPPALINALDATRHAPGTFENIRIVGKGAIDRATGIDHRGRIDGNGWTFKATPTVTDEVGNVLPLYASGSSSTVQTLGILAKDQLARSTAAGAHNLTLSNAYSQRRSSLILLRGVQNAYYSGFVALNPAFHGVINLETGNVIANGVVSTTYDANNADGMEFLNSDGVMVFNSFFDTGDDCINFGSGQGALAALQAPTQNVWVFDNYFREGHGAVVAGSNTGAWIQDVLVEDNVMYLTDDGLRMKSAPQNGGGARRWLFRDNALKDITNSDATSGLGGNERGPFTFILNYAQNGNTVVPASVPAHFQDIVVRNVTVDGGTKLPAYGSINENGGPDRSEAALHVSGFDPTNPATVDENGYGHIYHQNLVFDHVLMTGMAPVRIIDHLSDSVFNDVPSWTAAGLSPWILAATHGAECAVPPPTTLPLSSGCIYATQNITYSGSTIPPQ
jgi:exo-poly-alpha-galacturonosidase